MQQRIFRGFYVGNLRSEKSKNAAAPFTGKKTYRPIRRATVPLFIRKVPENDTEYLFQSGSIYYFFSIRKFVLLLDVGLSIGQNESRGLVITERVILKPDQRLKPFQEADFGPEKIRYGCWLWMGFVNDNDFFLWTLVHYYSLSWPTVQPEFFLKQFTVWNLTINFKWPPTE